MKIRDRIKEMRRVKGSELNPNPKNWRTHGDGQRGALSGVLKDVGVAAPLIARELDDGSLELIDGHLRQDMDPEIEWPVVVLDVDEKEADMLLATMDPLSALAGQDDQRIADLLQGLEEENRELAKLTMPGLDMDELLQSLNGEVEGLTDHNDIPDPPVDPVTKAGDLWLMGDHRLLCGDSTKSEDVVMVMDGEKINVAFTSPPYAMQRKYDEKSGFKPIHPDHYVEWWDAIQSCVATHLACDGSFFVNIKPSVKGLDTHMYVFDLILAMVRKWGWHFATEFCWERSGVPKRVTRRFKNQFEPIYQFTRGDWKMRPDAVRHESNNVPVAIGKGAGNTSWKELQGRGSSNNGWFDGRVKPGLAYPGNRIPTFSSSHTALGHAAAFPVGLPGFFVAAYSDEKDIVYDPFLGSGSTIIAAEQLHRRCYGMEISPAYCDVIVNRWEGFTGKQATLRANQN